MTPAELKAKELIEWFFNIIQPSTTNTCNPMLVREQVIKAKQCAIKVCEEILKFYKRYDGGIDNDEYEEQVDYYQQVKEAINNYGNN